jgi:hypothetical protein
MDTTNNLNLPSEDDLKLIVGRKSKNGSIVTEPVETVLMEGVVPGPGNTIVAILCVIEEADLPIKIHFRKRTLVEDGGENGFCDVYIYQDPSTCFIKINEYLLKIVNGEEISDDKGYIFRCNCEYVEFMRRYPVGRLIKYR